MNPIPDDELLSAYLDGELVGEDLARAERLLAEQPECRQALEELRALSGSIESLPRYRLEADFAQRVLRLAEREMLMGDDAEPSSAAPQATPDAAPERLVTRPSLAVDHAGAPDLGGRLWPRAKRPLLYAALTMAAGVLIMIFAPGQPPHADRANQRVAIAPKASGRLGGFADEKTKIGPTDSDSDAASSEYLAKTMTSSDQLNQGGGMGGGQDDSLESMENGGVESLSTSASEPADPAPFGGRAPAAPADDAPQDVDRETLERLGARSDGRPVSLPEGSARPESASASSKGRKRAERRLAGSAGDAPSPAPGGAGGGYGGGGMRGARSRPDRSRMARGLTADAVSLEDVVVLSRTAEPDLMIVECVVAADDDFRRDFHQLLSRQRIDLQVDGDRTLGARPGESRAGEPQADSAVDSEETDSDDIAEAGARDIDAFNRNADRLKENLRQKSIREQSRPLAEQQESENLDELKSEIEPMDSALIYVEVSRDQLEGLLADLDAESDVYTKIQVQPAPDEWRQQGLDAYSREHAGKAVRRKGKAIAAAKEDASASDSAGEDKSELGKFRATKPKGAGDTRELDRSQERFGRALWIFPPNADRYRLFDSEGEPASGLEAGVVSGDEPSASEDQSALARKKNQDQVEPPGGEAPDEAAPDDAPDNAPLKALFIFRRAAPSDAPQDDQPPP